MSPTSFHCSTPRQYSIFSIIPDWIGCQACVLRLCGNYLLTPFSVKEEMLKESPREALRSLSGLKPARAEPQGTSLSYIIFSPLLNKGLE